MYIKRYSIAALALILLVGWYVFAFVTHDTYSLNFFGVNLPALPIAVYITVPLLVLYLASVFHMSYYSIIGSFKLRKFQKDYEKLSLSIHDALLQKEGRNTVYKTERYQTIGKLLDNCTIVPDDSLESIGIDKVDALIEKLTALKNSEVVDLKKLNLPFDNAIAQQNEENRYNKGEILPEVILSLSDRHPAALCQEAFYKFIIDADMASIEKYKQYIDKKSIFVVLERINSDINPIEVSNESLIVLINEIDLDKNDFMKMASIIGSHMIPEQRMRLFELLGEIDEDAYYGYLYTLFDLEMFAPVDEFLSNSSADEYVQFKAYRALKECNKNFNVKLFLAIDCE